MKLTYAVTDVHGCLGLLDILLAACRRGARSHEADPFFIFLGDYVDRGPDSAGVIDRVRTLVEKEGAVALRGNHDEMMVDAILRNDPGLWLYNRGLTTAKSYGIDGVDGLQDYRDLCRHPQAIADARWIDTLPYSFEDDLRFYVHAGIDPRVSLDKQTKYDMVWIREPFLSHSAPFEKFIVHGHTPHSGYPLAPCKNRCNLDTGAVFRGTLTAGVFDDERLEPLRFIAINRDETS